MENKTKNKTNKQTNISIRTITQLCKPKDSMKYRFGLPPELLFIGTREKCRLQNLAVACQTMIHPDRDPHSFFSEGVQTKITNKYQDNYATL